LASEHEGRCSHYWLIVARRLFFVIVWEFDRPTGRERSLSNEKIRIGSIIQRLTKTRLINELDDFLIFGVLGFS